MSKGSANTVVAVGLGLLAIFLIFVVLPDVFDNTPKIQFFEIPNPTESEVKVGTSTIIKVTARNQEDDFTAKDVYAKLSVVRGEGAEEHLEFEEFTKLSDTIPPGEVSDTKNISIRAIKLSGEKTPFRMSIEILIDGTTGTSTATHEFDLTIIPRN